MDDPTQIEARGASEGINPMFGEWVRKFDLEPVSYQNSGDARRAFKSAVRALLDNKFVFVGEVRVSITLYLEEQKALETPAYGDLDNHAKQILDCIKGRGGLLIDDCQVQRLEISWIDVPRGAYFEVGVRGMPDDFLPDSLRLYEMPDGLFYPLSDKYWTTEGLVDTPAAWLKMVADAIAVMTRNKRAFRHTLRTKGVPEFRAFQASKFVAPSVCGFHRTRIQDSGYDLVPLRNWSL
ncbi:MAG: RusA family crossover junction endodeoxyribonuclease [Planctomycetes bacterium]|jgi:Holliday junction resolvase RusA-like endonuclease|nr:RusA family crossover junction endodeoxyribonuclease [Planctomycetota bacterium]